MRRQVHAGKDHQNVASSLNNLAALLQTQGRLDEAERLYVESLDMTRRLHARPPKSAGVSGARAITGEAGSGAGDGAAGALVEASTSDAGMSGGDADVEDHPDVAAALNNLWCVFVRKRSWRSSTSE